MQLGYSALLAALTAATTALAQVSGGYHVYVVPDPKGPELTSPYTSVSFYNGSLYTGAAKTNYESEPFIFQKSTNDPSGLSFTSYHQSPTGWQNMWIYPTRTGPPGFTAPHSGFVPPGADMAGFTIGATDRRLRYRKTNRWHACPVKGWDGYYQIIYVGNKVPKGCTAVQLKVMNYGRDCVGN